MSKIVNEAIRLGEVNDGKVSRGKKELDGDWNRVLKQFDQKQLSSLYLSKLLSIKMIIGKDYPYARMEHVRINQGIC